MVCHEGRAEQRQLAVVGLYCIVTGGCVLLSLGSYTSFTEWLVSSDTHYHCLHLLYYLLNYLFLGRLKTFEKRRARRRQLRHLVNTLTFISMTSGFDLFEGFCWLHWATPFSFFRMSLSVISQRLENLSISPLESVSAPREQRGFDSGTSRLGVRSDGFPAKKIRRRGVDSLQDHPKPGLLGGHHCQKFFFRWEFFERLKKCQRSLLLVYGTSTAGQLLMYLAVLGILLTVWLCFGLFWLFRSAPLSSKILLSYEPAVCGVQLFVVIAWCLLSISVVPLQDQADFSDVEEIVDGLNKHDIQFLLQWAGSFFCQALCALRYGFIWFLFGHSWLFNVVDLFIFMKLKSVFSGLSMSTHNLRVFLSVRRIMSRNFPTRYFCSPSQSATLESSKTTFHRAPAGVSPGSFSCAFSTQAAQRKRGHVSAASGKPALLIPHQSVRMTLPHAHPYGGASIELTSLGESRSISTVSLGTTETTPSQFIPTSNTAAVPSPSSMFFHHVFFSSSNAPLFLHQQSFVLLAAGQQLETALRWVFRIVCTVIRRLSQTVSQTLLPDVLPVPLRRLHFPLVLSSHQSPSGPRSPSTYPSDIHPHRAMYSSSGVPPTGTSVTSPAWTFPFSSKAASSAAPRSWPSSTSSISISAASSMARSASPSMKSPEGSSATSDSQGATLSPALSPLRETLLQSRTLQNERTQRLDCNKLSAISHGPNSSPMLSAPASGSTSLPLCVICRDAILVGKELPCGHLLHQHCLRRWLETDITCPICRATCMSPEDQKGEGTNSLVAQEERSGRSLRSLLDAVRLNTLHARHGSDAMRSFDSADEGYSSRFAGLVTETMPPLQTFS